MTAKRNGHAEQRKALASGTLFATLVAVSFWLMADAPAAQKRISNPAPVVAITSPARDATLTVPLDLRIAAEASDSHAITRVEFFVGKKRIGVDATAPYEATWLDVAAGTYEVAARAYDTLGANTRVSASITVNADPRASSGEWTSSFPWPDVGIHIHVLPNENILTWADDDNLHYHIDGIRDADRLKSYVVTDLKSYAPKDLNPEPPAWVEIDNEKTNLFCSGHAFLPDGRLLVMGGHEGANGEGSVDANIFDYRQGVGSWSKSADMASGRWYPTAITLANGDVLTVAGSGVGNPEIPEVWSARTGTWRSLPGALRFNPYYPFLQLASNGKVFMSGPNTGYDGANPVWTSSYLDTTGTGSWTPVASLHVPDRSYGSAIMYEPDRIVVIGGGDPPTATNEVINLRSAPPVWNYTGSMAYARRQHNSTLLPDGTVVVTGGSSAAGFSDATGAVYAAELWQPSTGRWSTLAPARVPRLYHSTAVLLPDGRVLSAGGGRPASTGEDSSTEHRDAEIFSPPYLFKGFRPVVTWAPDRVGYRGTFLVTTPDAARIEEVSWIRLSSASHSLNMSQRINRLKFTRTATNDGLWVTAPSRAVDAPPGHYMLFLLSANGVPSIAKIVQIE